MSYKQKAFERKNNMLEFESLKEDQLKAEQQLKDDIKRCEAFAIANDSRIAELKLTNQDLEKFNFVHKFTLDELDKQVEPLRIENDNLKGFKQVLVNEVNEKRSNCRIVKKEIITLKRRLRVSDLEIKSVKRKISEVDSKNSEIIRRVQELRQRFCLVTDGAKPNNRLLNNEIVIIYQCFVLEKLDFSIKSQKQLLRHINQQTACLTSVIAKQEKKINQSKQLASKRISNAVEHHRKQEVQVHQRQQQIQLLKKQFEMLQSAKSISHLFENLESANGTNGYMLNKQDVLIDLNKQKLLVLKTDLLIMNNQLNKILD